MPSIPWSTFLLLPYRVVMLTLPAFLLSTCEWVHFGQFGDKYVWVCWVDGAKAKKMDLGNCSEL